MDQLDKLLKALSTASLLNNEILDLVTVHHDFIIAPATVRKLEKLSETQAKIKFVDRFWVKILLRIARGENDFVQSSAFQLDYAIHKEKIAQHLFRLNSTKPTMATS